MPTTYIIGHTKPDTDAVVAALALEFLFKDQDCFGYSKPKAVIADPVNPETSFLFEKFGVATPPVVTSQEIANDQVVLVDHNEEAQRLDGLTSTQIVEIYDHHKANINLPTPIFITFRAWGSTSTIIYDRMKQLGSKPDEKLAGLMLSAILSDTVGFKSATTTNKDRELGQDLAQLAGIDDINALAFEIFKAKSDISALTDQQIVTNDYKIFDFAQRTFINQVETVQQQQLLNDKKDDLLAAMAKVKTDQAVELVFVAITDILKVNTKLLLLGEAEAKVAQQAFAGQAKDNLLDIGAKLSRKKEIAPAIEQALNK